MIKAIIFDFDGLIFDTETPEYLAFQEIYKEFDLNLELEIWSQWVGTDISRFNPYDYLEESLGRKIDREIIRQKRREKYEYLIRNETVRPGVLQYIKSAKKLGLKVGLASSATREWVIENLKKLDLIEQFDCIRVREDVNKVKPEPDLYLQVLEYFNVQPQNAVVFEDSPNGALAAKRAGTFCVVIPNEVTKGLFFGHVDLKLDSMAQKTLEEVIQLASENDLVS